MGGSVSAGRDNGELTDNLVHSSCINSKTVEKVFRVVDRRSYYSRHDCKTAYEDSAWKDGNLHLSAPSIYAKVMEGLKLRPNLSFLNMGSGTGYLSTMVGLIIGSGANSCSHGVEINEDTVRYAYTKLEEFIQTSHSFDEYDFCSPQFFTGNCLKIFTDNRYDRIYCGAMCEEDKLMFLKDLLKIGGIAVVPVGNQLLQITRKSQEEFDQDSIAAVTFAELISSSAEDEDVKLPEMEVRSLKELCRVVVRGCVRTNMQRRLGDLNVRRIPRHNSDNMSRFLHSQRVNSFVARYGNLAAAVANANHHSDSETDTSDNDDGAIEFSDEEEVVDGPAEAAQERVEAVDGESDRCSNAEEMDSSSERRANDCSTQSSLPSNSANDSMMVDESLPAGSTAVIGSADSGFSTELAPSEPQASSHNDLSSSSREEASPASGAGGSPAPLNINEDAARDSEPPSAPADVDTDEMDDTSSSDSGEDNEDLRSRSHRRIQLMNLLGVPPEPPARPPADDDENERALNREKAHRYHLAFAQTMYSSVMSLPLPTSLKDYLLYYRDVGKQPTL